MTSDIAPRALLHTIAKLHYESDLSQVEIARRLKVSTATISRLLRKAREEGIVRIEIRDLRTPAEIERRLLDRLGLRDVAVVDAAEAGSLAALAGPVGSILRDAGLGAGSVLAIGWGRAVRDVIAAGLPRLPGVITIPATGGMEQPAPHFQVGEFVRIAAEQMGGTPRFIHAPYLPSNAWRKALLQDATVADHVALWDRVDAAIVGIGVPHAVDPGPGRLHLTSSEQALARAAGDVVRHYFDSDGRLVPWDGESRLIAMSPAQLRAVPRVIGVAASPIKAGAILGAVRAKLINVLVTDARTAQAILDLA